MSRNSKLSKTRATFNNLISGGARITEKRTLSASEVSRKRRRTSSPDEEEGGIKDMLSKILRQNTEMSKKIDELLLVQKSLEGRMSRIEETSVDNPVNVEFVNNIVKDIAEVLFDESVYPNDEQFRKATEEYLESNHPEYYNSFDDKGWTVFYNNHIHKPLSKKHRSLRGSLTTRIKESLFTVFGEDNLPPINTHATAREIYTWKSSEKVHACHRKLFREIEGDKNETTYMSRILQRVWTDGENTPAIHSAFAISICTTILNPNNENIQISESVVKPQILSNLRKILRNEGFRDPIVDIVDEGEYDEESVVAEGVVRPRIVSSTATTTASSTETTTAPPTETTTTETTTTPPTETTTAPPITLGITPDAPRRRLRSG